MTESQDPEDAAFYRIKVSGRLRESWSDWFNGMTVESGSETHGKPITTLTGLVADQSALHGLLNRIRDLGLELLSVEQVALGQESG